MIGPLDGDEVVRPEESEIRARAEAAVSRLPPSLQRLVAWLLAHWPGRIVIRTMLSCVRVGLFDRSMTIAAQFFTSVLPILILVATWRSARDTGRLADALGIPPESRQVLEEAVQGGDAAAFGIVGALMVLVSATSLSRALTRAYASTWMLPNPKMTLGSAWRWLAVVGVLTLGLVAVRALANLAEGVPPEGIWQPVVSLACDLALGFFVPWVLLSGTLRLRLLAPGALLFALAMSVFRPASAVWLPRALEASEDRYGSLGVSFTYLAWLYVVAFILLTAALLGQVIATDRSSFGRWIRDDPPTSAEVMHPG